MFRSQNADGAWWAQIVDTVIYAVNGRRAFKIDATEVTVDTLDDWQIIILFICQVTPPPHFMMALIVSTLGPDPLACPFERKQ